MKDTLLPDGRIIRGSNRDVVVPAYNRTYATNEAALKDWEEGKDFILMTNGSTYRGKYCSIRDCIPRNEVHIFLHPDGIIPVKWTAPGISKIDFWEKWELSLSLLLTDDVCQAYWQKIYNLNYFDRRQISIDFMGLDMPLDIKNMAVQLARQILSEPV